MIMIMMYSSVSVCPNIEREHSIFLHEMNLLCIHKVIIFTLYNCQRKLQVQIKGNDKV